MTRGKTRSRRKTDAAALDPVQMVRAADAPDADGGLDDERATGQAAGLSEDVLESRQELLEDAARGIRQKEGPARDPTGNEIENGPQVDPTDPNLSAVMAEAGAQEDQASLGMQENDGRMQLEDPEKTS